MRRLAGGRPAPERPRPVHALSVSQAGPSWHTEGRDPITFLEDPQRRGQGGKGRPGLLPLLLLFAASLGVQVEFQKPFAPDT